MTYNILIIIYHSQGCMDAYFWMIAAFLEIVILYFV